MKPLDKLQVMAHDENIVIRNFDLGATKKAACLHTDGCKYIIIDKNKVENKQEETVLLSEEIAHYKTDSLYLLESTYNTPIASLNRIKCEGMAKHWQREFLLSREMLHNAYLEGIVEISELSEYFDLPYNYVKDTIYYYSICESSLEKKFYD